ncbi:MAG: hypothetical protein KGI06_06125 [Candidatus Micrarchaeota archaeon]|nr:hypothetical protein [Candidatus Micrarchaeota archaeon]
MRNDYGAFYLAMNSGYDPLWFQQDILAPALEKVNAGELKRLMIFEPPRHGKSSFVTVTFPPWYLGHHPTHSIITLSYSDVLAAGFGRQVRDIMQGELYGSLFPKSRLKADSRAKDAFNTISGGRYTAAGLNGTITGIGADLLIIDDPVSSGVSAASEADEANRRSIYVNTARTRMQAGGSILVVMTRWFGSAFEGWLLEQSGWDHYDPRKDLCAGR